MLHLRNIEMADAVQLMRLDLKGYDTPWDADRWRTLANNPDENAICVTDERKQPISFAAYNLETNQIKILRLTVAPSWRRKRVGYKMVKWLVDMGTDRRYRRVSCLAPADNLEACLFLKACGFKVPAKGGIMPGAFENCGYKVDGYYFMLDLR